MSNVHPINPDDSGDDIKVGKIVLVGAVSVLTFALSAVVAKIILDVDNAKYAEQGVAGFPETRALDAKHEIGMVDFVPFDSDTRLEQWRARVNEALSSYGWVDKEKKIIHIPIEAAMKEVIQRASQTGAPSP